MILVTSAQMREIEARACALLDMPSEILMATAGECVAEQAILLADRAALSRPRIQLLAGRGNNGGDAFVAARILHESDYPVQVVLAGTTDALRGDALLHYNHMKEAGIEAIEIPTPEQWKTLESHIAPADMLVDGVLGTGITGPARGPAAGAIEYINRMRTVSRVLAIDVPSGLNADTGDAEGPVVRADTTLTLGFPKTGLLTYAALEYVGELEVADIGLPEATYESIAEQGGSELIHASDLRPLFPRRARTAHKGTYGHVLILAGARGYSGAAVLAAHAALRSGAGLVTVLTPESVAAVIAASTPEIMVHPMPETDMGSLSHEGWDDWNGDLEAFDAILFGPGVTRHNDTLLIARQLIRESTKPLVLDADAISVFPQQPHWLDKAVCPLVLTPHPGELATLLGREVDDIQADREAVALETARITHATVALKGSRTLVAHPNHPLQINTTGNPGMASGGTGDALAGLLTGLLAQGLETFDATRAAVYLHGRAGDIASWDTTEAGLIATDLIHHIPTAFKDLVMR